MDTSLNKSYSETDVSSMDIQNHTPTNFVASRQPKRKRNEEKDYGEFKEEMKAMLESFIERQDRESVTKEIRQSINNIENSLTILSEQNEDLKKKLDMMESEKRKDREYITLLEDKLEDMHRQSRKTCIEIRNVPYKKDETQQDLLTMTQELSKTIDVHDFSNKDVRDIFRVKKKEHNKTVVVELQSALVKKDILFAAKKYNSKNKSAKLCARHLGITEKSDEPIFIAEQLTPKAARLYFLARDLAKSKAYKFCWTAYGKVNVRKDEQSPFINITSEEQVQRLMNVTK